MREELIQVLKAKGLLYSEEPIELKHGIKTRYYYDVKAAVGNPSALDLLAENLWKIMDKGTTCVADGGYGGVPLGTALELKYNLKHCMVRNKPKQHGKGGWIDGYVPTKEDKVAIIDDVATTGGSLNDIIKVIEPTGAEILGCYVVVKRGDAVLKHPYTLKWVLTADDLL